MTINRTTLDVQLRQGPVTALTDNSGGTPSDTIAAIGATYVQATQQNAVASLAAKVNALRAELVKAGIL